MNDATRNRIVLVVCCVAQFMAILDVTVINVALPSIRADLGFSATGLQWVVNAYTLAIGGFLMLGGRSADLLGRRRMFVIGLSLFSVASLVGGLSGSQATLVAARAAMGLGGAIVVPGSLAILSATFTSGPERNRALGAWGAMGGLGGVAGSLLGGVLTEYLGWEWTLFINVPIGVAAALVAYRYVHRDRPTEGERSFDALGAVVVTAGLTALSYGIVSTDAHGWTSEQTLGPMALGLVLLGAFVFIEERVAARPLFQFRLLRVRAVSGANVVMFVLGAVSLSMWFLLSLYAQTVRDYSPIKTGLMFAPGALSLAAASILAGRVTQRFGAGRVMTAGLVLDAIGLAGMSRFGAGGSIVLTMMLPTVVSAAGIGLSFVPTTIGAMSGVAPAEGGLASGLLNTSRQVGGSLGIAVLGTIAAHGASPALHGEAAKLAAAGGFDHAFAGASAITLAGAVAGMLLMPARLRPQRADVPNVAGAEA